MRFRWRSIGSWVLWIGASGMLGLRAETMAYTVQTWGMESGLPHPMVCALAQTDDGYLWVATPGGLARFDGERFAKPPGAELFNGEHRATSLCRGAGGVLWLGTQDGALVKFSATGFETILPVGTADLSNGVRCLAEDDKGNLWVTTYHHQVGVLRDGKMKICSDAWSDSIDQAFQASVQPDGVVLVSSSNGLWRVKDDRLQPLCRFKPGYIYHAPGYNGRFWLSDNKHLLRWKVGQIIEEAEVMGTPRMGVKNVTFGIEDHAGALWLATRGHGLLVYGADGTEEKIGLENGLGAKFVLCLFCDREGAVWVGTEDGGLSRILPEVFSRWDHASGLASDRVSAICPLLDEELLVGTVGDGVFLLTQGKMEKLPGNNAWETANVTAVVKTGSGAVWAATAQGILIREPDGSMSRIPGIEHDNAMTQVFLDPGDGTIWVGRASPHPLLRAAEGKIQEIPLGVGAMDIRALALDDQGWLWIGTEDQGLYRWKDGTTEKLGLPHGSMRTGIRGIEAGMGEVWIASHGGGIWRWRNGEMRTFTQADGLPDNTLVGMRMDQRNGLWISSIKGFFRLEVSDLNAWFDGCERPPTPVVFGKSDGLAGLAGYGSSQGGTALDAGSGRLWFSSNGGVVRIRPEMYRPPTVAPLVAIERFLVDSVAHGQDTVIEPGARRYEFHFTGMGLAHPEGLVFASRLDGVDREWVDMEKRRWVSYSTLAPGDYRFRVKAIDRDGVSGKLDAEWHFKVAPPFWRKGWFVTLCVASTVLAMWMIFRVMAARKLRRYLEQARLAGVQIAERSRIARDMHDQLGSSLTTLALIGDRLQRNMPGHEDANEVSTRARDLICAMDETVWLLNPRNDSLESLATYLARSAKEWVKQSGIRCRLAVDPDFGELPISSESRRSLFLGCKEAVHNVLKHSGASEMVLRICRSGNRCEVTISDNGKGFPRNLEHAGNGLQNMRERMRELGGDAVFGQSAGGGASVTLRLPLADGCPP